MATESHTWKTLLQPLVTALVAFLAAATLYLQRSEGEENNAWQARTDQRIEYLEHHSSQRDIDFDNLRTILGDVRADVSFIRGKLENRK